MGLKVFDGVLYNGEVDVLECRLVELAEAVDLFVIVEGDKTFTGRPKERAPRERFAAWGDKLLWVDHETPTSTNPWDVESATRNHLFEVFERQGVADGDVVTVCDADEIWHPSMVESFAQDWHAVHMRHLVFSVHWQGPTEVTCVGGPWGKRFDTADRLRRSHRQTMPWLFGGWHVAWMGGPKWCADKIRSFSHQEYNKGEVDADMVRCFSEAKFIDGLQLTESEIEADWPKWIVDGKHPTSWVWRK